ncbi:helix-turn-helix domain-containing protein [Actinomadura sp. WMMA1423]|uniref:winged helix-turn-helix transcriptional regulator n=1 Tax=Actinomadura sp. WMMA1423 TaxID=2591108 RepID=UPI00197A9105|nr:helix-turn-helix domain-containing protein [Actinomadura sp. WMMA1423]
MKQPLDPDMFSECRAAESPLIRIGDKWTGRIVRCLESGPRRFSELREPLRGITPKVLTETLRAMERDGLVERTVHREMPPRVEYELTSLGRTLREPMAACCAWSDAHQTQVWEARDAHERSTLDLE